MPTINVHIQLRHLFVGDHSQPDFPGSLEGKASACNAGDLGSIPGSGRSPSRRKWQPSPVFLPGESHGWRSLVSYSLWGHKESDKTERFHFSHTVNTAMAKNHTTLGELIISGEMLPSFSGCVI